eukprot:TRINITY_DN776338_c0_g1_i1.p1 TRINITY_DN776338_c0_g1~~TRINITY_DN776338_c0_g1_i1.p1  ORF type:complete len:104 (-),score=18.57 TRINITY_DN776338_c0_g1_i1:121-432(-)
MSLSDEIEKREALRAKIENILSETGEMERLQEFVEKELTESGWADLVKEECRTIIKSKGAEVFTSESLVKEIQPFGRSHVPDSVKSELLQRIRAILKSFSIDE